MTGQIKKMTGKLKCEERKAEKLMHTLARHFKGNKSQDFTNCPKSDMCTIASRLLVDLQEEDTKYAIMKVQD